MTRLPCSPFFLPKNNSVKPQGSCIKALPAAIRYVPLESQGHIQAPKPAPLSPIRWSGYGHKPWVSGVWAPGRREGQGGDLGDMSPPLEVRSTL